MKLKSSSVTRKGDLVTVRANWITRFRQPAYVKISITEEGHPHEGLLVDGDVIDTHGLLFGIAQIAWNIGWRPAGLLEATMETIRSHKVGQVK